MQKIQVGFLLLFENLSLKTLNYCIVSRDAATKKQENCTESKFPIKNDLGPISFSYIAFIYIWLDPRSQFILEIMPWIIKFVLKLLKNELKLQII